jgi:hypothetical protein
LLKKQCANGIAPGTKKMKIMNMPYPTLSADGLRFENEFAQESAKSVQPKKNPDKPVLRASLERNGGVVSEEMENLMILGR